MQKRLRVFSKHPSHQCFREANFRFPMLACVRLGSTTKGHLKYDVEINSTEAVGISANKLLMKQKFSEGGVKTADWWTLNTILTDSGFPNFYCNPSAVIQQGNGCYHAQLPYPIVAKNIFGSRGTGNYLLKTKEDLERWLVGKDLTKYIFEKFYDYSREYRLHVTADGCFYTCRKMLRGDVEERNRWYRNDSNSVWIVEENEKFDKPVNWEEIVAECVKALGVVGLDIGAMDVRVQSARDKKGVTRDNPKFIILESNSAPSMGRITEQKYKEIIPQLINKKHLANGL